MTTTSPPSNRGNINCLVMFSPDPPPRSTPGSGESPFNVHSFRPKPPKMEGIRDISAVCGGELPSAGGGNYRGFPERHRFVSLSPLTKWRGDGVMPLSITRDCSLPDRRWYRFTGAFLFCPLFAGTNQLPGGPTAKF